jgi:hypothetical protein
MGVSLQYHATRETPLTEAEKEALLSCIAEHGEPSVDEPTESFGFYEFYAPDFKPWREHSILTGSTKVRENEEIKHWIALLGKCRPIVPEAEWSINLEGESFSWDEASQSYVPPIREVPPTLELPFPPDIQVSPDQFHALVAARVSCDPSDSESTIREAVVREIGEKGRILFRCTDDMSRDQWEALRTQRLMWGITGKLSYPGFEIDWKINVNQTKD